MKTIFSKIPIDFTFHGFDEKNKLKVVIGKNRGKARKIQKETPFIYYDRKFNDNRRSQYEVKRKTMLTKNEYAIVDQYEFRVLITKYPNCFLLVDLSPTRTEWFDSNFPGHPKILEFIQIREIPDNGNAIEPAFNYGEEDRWFEINDTDKFYPETGM